MFFRLAGYLIEAMESLAAGFVPLVVFLLRGIGFRRLFRRYIRQLVSTAGHGSPANKTESLASRFSRHRPGAAGTVWGGRLRSSSQAGLQPSRNLVFQCRSHANPHWPIARNCGPSLPREGLCLVRLG